MSNQFPAGGNESARGACSLTCGVLGCLGVVGLLAVGTVATLLFTFFHGQKTFEPVVNRFLDSMNAENYDAVYNMLSNEWQTSQDKSDTIKYLRDVRANLGPCTRHHIVSVSMQTFNMESSATVVVRARFKRGSGSVELRFVKEAGQWRIGEVKYDSSRLGPMVNPAEQGRSVTLLRSPFRHPASTAMRGRA